jgi:hypothetical protein
VVGGGGGDPDAVGQDGQPRQGREQPAAGVDRGMAVSDRFFETFVHKNLVTQYSNLILLLSVFVYVTFS